MRFITPTLSICALAAAFTAGALTAGPLRAEPASTPAAAQQQHAGHDGGSAVPAAPAAGSTAPTAEPVITVSGFAFDVPPIAAGQTVRLVNLDSAPHTITADDGTFNVFVDAGAEVTFTAPAAGTYSFFCEIHPSMTGVLTVG